MRENIIVIVHRGACGSMSIKTGFTSLDNSASATSVPTEPAPTINPSFLF